MYVQCRSFWIEWCDKTRGFFPAHVPWARKASPCSSVHRLHSPGSVPCPHSCSVGKSDQYRIPNCSKSLSYCLCKKSVYLCTGNFSVKFHLCYSQRNFECKEVGILKSVIFDSVEFSLSSWFEHTCKFTSSICFLNHKMKTLKSEYSSQTLKVRPHENEWFSVLNLSNIAFLQHYYVNMYSCSGWRLA